MDAGVRETSLLISFRNTTTMMKRLEITIANTVTCIQDAALCLTGESAVRKMGVSDTNREEYYNYLQASALLRQADLYLAKSAEHARNIGNSTTGETSLDLPGGTLTLDKFGNIIYLGQLETGTISMVKRITGFLEITWKTDSDDILITLESRGRMYLETSRKKCMYYPDATIFTEDDSGRKYIETSK